MRTIYKYELGPDAVTKIIAPRGANFLFVGVQNRSPFVWALVDLDEPKVEHELLVLGTGHNASNAGTHVGSFMLDGGLFVFHVFLPLN